MNSENYALVLVLLLTVFLPLYIYWKHPKWVKAFEWIILALGTAFIFLGAVWKDGIPNGLILGLFCGSGFLFVGYLRFFWKEKFAKGLIDGLDRERDNSNFDSKNDV